MARSEKQQPFGFGVAPAFGTRGEIDRPGPLARPGLCCLVRPEPAKGKTRFFRALFLGSIGPATSNSTVNCLNENQPFHFVGQQAFGPIICLLMAPALQGGSNEQPNTGHPCYDDNRNRQHSDGHEQSLQKRLSLVVRSNV
jgi:hypothetical protein